jgi:hypothetical protein
VDGFTSLDPAGVPVAASGADELGPALAADGSGRLLCIYENREADGAPRVAARMITVP